MVVATKAYAPTQTERETINEIHEKWEACQAHHASFEREYDRREESYRGILRSTSSAAQWKHKAHPALGFNLIETVISNTVEQGLRFDVVPSPWVNMPLPEAQRMLAQNEAVADLLRHQHRVDGMDEKQRPLFLTAAIGGRGVLRTGWNRTERAVLRQEVQNVEIYDEEENLLGTVPEVVDVTDYKVRDHSSAEVINPKDFIVHEAAKNLQPFEDGGAQYLFERQWYSFEQLKVLEQGGFLKNIDYLVDQKNVSEGPKSSDVFATNIHKDLIEVWEYWCMKDGYVSRVIMSANGVILRDGSMEGSIHKGNHEISPFMHGHYPYVICSSMPQPFSTIGVSDVELIEQIQLMIWETMNQRLDNAELINNFIILLREDVEDPDALQAFPGAQWMLENPSDVQTLQPPFQLAEATLHSEALLRGDLQNVTSSAPFAGGTETATVDQKTATGASIVMNAAQARLIAKKWQSMLALKSEANIRIQNCQQFIDEKQLVHVVGPDGATAFREIEPEAIQGDYYAELNPESDSNMRQEKRAEAGQFIQIAAGLAPIMAASQQPLNMGELFRWFAHKWDIHDVERFLSMQPAALGAQAVGPGGGGEGGGGDPTQQNLGVTAPAAPGAEMGASPVTALQRAAAFGGGPANAPVGR